MLIIVSNEFFDGMMSFKEWLLCFADNLKTCWKGIIY